MWSDWVAIFFMAIPIGITHREGEYLACSVKASYIILLDSAALIRLRFRLLAEIILLKSQIRVNVVELMR